MSKYNWVRKHVAEMEAKRERFQMEGRELRPLTKEELAELTDAAKEVFPELIKKWTFIVFEKDLTKVGRLNGTVDIRHHKSRWGSCSSQGTLTFNCLLMLAPEDVRDYVVVHELCHLLHMNHSSAFWNEVARAMPNYKKPYRWLREYESLLMARLPIKQ